MLETSFKIFFCKRFERQDDLQFGEIIIWPSSESWNDFLHKIHCNYVVKNLSGTLCEGKILVGFFNIKYELDLKGMGLGNAITEWQVGNDFRIPSSDIGEFYSLLPNMQEYRTLVDGLGVESDSFFKSINDIVSLGALPSAQAGNLKKFKQTPVFKIAFMRNSEHFFALHNALSILKGLEFESLNSISNTLVLNFKLNNFENNHHFEFYFSKNDLVSKRINILIGRNGLGKSQALKQIVFGAMRKRGHVKTLIDPNSVDNRVMINRLLAIGTPGEASSTFPSDNIKAPKIYYKNLSIDNKKNSKNKTNIGDSLQQILRSEDSIGGQNRYSLFLDAISKCIPIESLVLNFKNSYILDGKTQKKISLTKISRSNLAEQFMLNILSLLDESTFLSLQMENENHPLSSGQLSFFRMALLACLHIENGSLVLIDEPETHLHPNLISTFLDVLDVLLEKTGSFAIIATHSAYLVREVSREQVHIVKENSGMIEIMSPRLKTLGADIGTISHFVFEENVLGRLTDKIVKQASLNNMNYETIESNYSEELSSEALIQIRRKIKEVSI